MAVIGVSVLTLKGGLQTGILFHKLRRRSILHVFFQLAHFVFHTLQRLKNLQQLVFNPFVGFQSGILRQVSDPKTLLNIEIAGIGGIGAAKDLEQCCFACAVDAHQSHFFFILQVEGNVL